jgi:hypothetical protein
MRTTSSRTQRKRRMVPALAALRLVVAGLFALGPSGAQSVVIVVALTQCVAVDAKGADVGTSRVRIRDPSILRALEWMPRKPTVPIGVVNVNRLAARIKDEVYGACGFVIRGVPRIFISSRCPMYQHASDNPLDAIALAALIAHEMAHVEGADERQARQVEEELFLQLAQQLPGQYQVRVALYLDALRRRSPVTGETNSPPTAFQP